MPATEIRRPPHVKRCRRLCRPRGVLLILLTAPNALADKPILLESHLNQRPDDAQEHLTQLLAAIGAKVRFGDALRRVINDKLSREVSSVPIERSVRTQVAEGHREFIEGNYNKAVELLEQVRKALLTHTATLASNQSLRSSLHKALLVLGHAYLRTKQSALARQRIADAIRSFPDRGLSLIDFSPDLVDFYRQVQRELLRKGRTSLRVLTDPPGCNVFINERFAGISPTESLDLSAGRYRVYLQQGDRRGRLHDVEIGTRPREVYIDFRLDRVLRTAAYVGFEFSDSVELSRHETALAARVARSVDAPAALVVGFRQHQGRRMLSGALVSAETGQTVRSGMVVLGRGGLRSTAALGRFLLNGQAAPGLIVQNRGLTHTGDNAASSGRSIWASAKLWKWVTLGLAGAAAGTSVAMFVLDGRGTCDAAQDTACSRRYRTRNAGIGFSIGAAALAATATWLFWRDRKPKPRATAWAGHHGAGAIVHWRF